MQKRQNKFELNLEKFNKKLIVLNLLELAKEASARFIELGLNCI
jgi:hypothetical protein